MTIKRCEEVIRPVEILQIKGVENPGREHRDFIKIINFRDFETDHLIMGDRLIRSRLILNRTITN